MNTVGSCFSGSSSDKVTLTLWFRLLRSAQLSVSCVWTMSQCSASTTVCAKFSWPPAPPPSPRYMLPSPASLLSSAVLCSSHIPFTSPTASPSFSTLLSVPVSMLCAVAAYSVRSLYSYFLRIPCRNSAVSFLRSCDDSKLRQQ